MANLSRRAPRVTLRLGNYFWHQALSGNWRYREQYRSCAQIRCLRTRSYARNTPVARESRKWPRKSQDDDPSAICNPNPHPIAPGTQETPLAESPEPGVEGRALSSLSTISYDEDAAVSTQSAKAKTEQVATAEKFFGKGHKFLYSAEKFREHPINESTPEIVVLGASNVGKSSFLNALLGTSNTARVSQRPGRTTTMNAFGIGTPGRLALGEVRKDTPKPRHGLILMDTPGYGYKSRTGWGDTIIKYLDKRKMLRGAVLLLSSEKNFLKLDKWLLETLAETRTPTIVVLTKADKAGKEWERTCAQLAQQVRQETNGLERAMGHSWREGSGRHLEIYATSANMGRAQRPGNGAGIGGVRVALLDMAGYKLGRAVERKEERMAYSGKTVSFDNIPWKKS